LVSEVFEEGHQLLQYILKMLIEEYGYSRNQIGIEVEISGGLRPDLVVFANEEKKEPLIVVELKKPILYPVAAEQLSTYMKRIGAQYGMLTDGLRKFSFRSYGKDLIEISDIPRAKAVRDHQMFSEIGILPSIKMPQAPPYGLSLAYGLQKMFDYILVNEKFPVGIVLEELHKLILCKVEDERSGDKVLFRIEDNEIELIKNENTQKAIEDRLNCLFAKVKNRYSRLYPQDEPLRLDPLTLTYCVAQLQNYSLSKAPFNTISDAYREFIAKSRYGYLASEFTPKPLAELVVKLLDPTEKDRILDPACGSGTFLMAAITYVGEKIGNPIMKMEFAGNNVFGIDIYHEMITVSKMNMVLQGDGHTHLYKRDFLSNITDLEDMKVGSFDVVVVDPPQGGFISDPATLKNFELAEGRKAQRPHILFLEKCIEMLKPEGRLAMVIPESVLTQPALSYLRDFILRKSFVRAIISLPAPTLVSYLGQKVNLIILQNKRSASKDEDYDVFMVEAYDSKKETLEEIVEKYVRFRSEV
jgi:type I restriction enzyme M protein